MKEKRACYIYNRHNVNGSISFSESRKRMMIITGLMLDYLVKYIAFERPPLKYYSRSY